MVQRTVHIALAVDDALAKQLAVVLHSACRRLSAGWSLEVFVLGYRIGTPTRQFVEEALATSPLAIRWLELDLEAVRGHWPASRGAQITIYYRIYLGEAVPETVGRVLFLDVDVLVRGDLVELWSLPLDGHIALAVDDVYADWMHLPRMRALGPAADPAGVGWAGYFNAGVLLIDLAAWRRERIGQQAAAFLWRLRDRLELRDQDALNCALLGRWKRLPPAWNYHEVPQTSKGWRPVGSQEQVRNAIRSPQLVHFVGCNPWEPDCLHVHRKEWRRCASQVGLDPGAPSWKVRLLAAPHHDLHWHLTKGLARARTPHSLGAIARIVLLHPWVGITFPLWRTFLALRRLFRGRL